MRQLAKAFGNYSSLTTGGEGSDALAGAGAGGAGTALAVQPSAAVAVTSAGGGAGGGVGGGRGGGDGTHQKIPQGAREALKLAFVPEGGPVQDILLREMARYAGAAGSELATTIANAPAMALVNGKALIAPCSGHSFTDWLLVVSQCTSVLCTLAASSSSAWPFVPRLFLSFPDCLLKVKQFTLWALIEGLIEAQQAATDATRPDWLPVPTALELLAPVRSFVRQTEADRETLQVASELQDLIASLTGAVAASDTAGAGASGAGTWMEVPVFGEVPAGAYTRPLFSST